MKLYFEILKLLFNKYIRRQKTGVAIRKFCENMGVVYIKFAQILATQNFGEIFTEEDRVELSSICDNCNVIEYSKIKELIEKEYGKNIYEIFTSIDEKQIGAASISQVHRAVLKNGDVVAVKVKRRDITDGIEKDIKRIKKLMYRFGKFVKFGNFIGGENALNLYLEWIYQETDFIHETKNIKTYQEFANSVNGKVKDTKDIKVPKLYEDLCTENIIVMEYIESKTINKMEPSNENNDKISIAINSYIKSSFYALFNDKKIVFHGDPHGGNIYVDNDGNIGFLDMGLLFILSAEDAKLTKDFFFLAYTHNYDKLYEMLVPYGKMNDKQKEMFRKDVILYCENLKEKNVTAYFTDMMNVCLKYEFLPPKFLFCMAKAFVCLNGINGFSKNITIATDLLKEQVMEYYVRRGINDIKEILINGIKITPEFVDNTIRNGIYNGITNSILSINSLNDNFKTSLVHLKEIFDVVLPI